MNHTIMTIQYTGTLTKMGSTATLTNIALISFKWRNRPDFAVKYSEKFNEAVENSIKTNSVLAQVFTVLNFAPTMVVIIDRQDTTTES